MIKIKMMHAAYLYILITLLFLYTSQVMIYSYYFLEFFHVYS